MIKDRLMLCFCLILLVFVIASCSQPAPPTQVAVQSKEKIEPKGAAQPEIDTARRDATWKYWESLLKTTKDVDRTFKIMKAKDPDNVKDAQGSQDAANKIRLSIELCNRVRDELGVAIREFEGLPVLGVDSEAVDVGSMHIAVLTEFRSLLSDQTALLRELARFNEENSSLVTGFEVLVVGNKRLVEMQQKLKADHQKINERQNDLKRKNDKCNAEARRCRILLTNRYGKEFPVLE